MTGAGRHYGFCHSDENNFRCVRQETPVAARGAERRNIDEANRCNRTASMGSLSLNGKDSAATMTASSNVGSYKHGNGSCENGFGVQRTTFIAAFERLRAWETGSDKGQG